MESLTYKKDESIKFEYSFIRGSIDDIFQNISSHRILTINNCPSMPEAFEKIPTLFQEFFIKFLQAMCLHFMVDDGLDEIDDIQTHSLVDCFKGLGRSFVIIFQSIIDGSCLIYWQFKGAIPIFSLSLQANDLEIGSFIRNYLVNSMTNEHNGKFTGFVTL